MASPPAPVPLVRDYMPHFSAANNDPFDSNYKADLAPYLIDVAAPRNAPGLANSDRQIYTASGDTLTAFLLWLATPWLNPDKDPG